MCQPAYSVRSYPPASLQHISTQTAYEWLLAGSHLTAGGFEKVFISLVEGAAIKRLDYEAGLHTTEN
jgi:hypothetical protein